MMALVRLDDVAIKRRRDFIAPAHAEPNEFLVANDRESLARELPRRHSLDRRAERREVFEHRRARARVESAHVDSELTETFRDETIVLRFVAGLPRKRELDVDLPRGWNPARSALGRFDLVLERELQASGHRKM